MGDRSRSHIQEGFPGSLGDLGLFGLTFGPDLGDRSRSDIQEPSSKKGGIESPDLHKEKILSEYLGSISRFRGELVHVVENGLYCACVHPHYQD